MSLCKVQTVLPTAAATSSGTAAAPCIHYRFHDVETPHTSDLAHTALWVRLTAESAT